jgi:hypothetical protein
LINIHPFVKEKDESSRNFRLWALDLSVTIEIFENYLISSLKKNDNEYSENIAFPGIFLDKYENDYIGEIEEIINEKILILEYKKPSNSYYNLKDYFIFKKEKINFLENFQKIPLFENSDLNNSIEATYINNYFTKIGLCPISFYDDYMKFNSLVENLKENYLENNNSIFKVSNYFCFKYGINIYNSDFFSAKRGTPEFANEKNRLFQEEILFVKNNLEEVYEKQDIINKFGIFFSKTENKNFDNNISNSKQNSLPQEKLLSRYQQIMKNRNLKDKKNKLKIIDTNNININDNEIKLINLGSKTSENNKVHIEDKIQENIILEANTLSNLKSSNLNQMTCKYCNREIEQDDEYEKCENCNEFYYCNDTCKTKDSKFHKKKCKNK